MIDESPSAWCKKYIAGGGLCQEKPARRYAPAPAILASSSFWPPPGLFLSNDFIPRIFSDIIRGNSPTAPEKSLALVEGRSSSPGMTSEVAC
jgi:hypothetical protein